MFEEAAGHSTLCCRCHPLIPEVASTFATDRARHVRGQVKLFWAHRDTTAKNNSPSFAQMGHKYKRRQKNLITLKFLLLKVSHTCFNHQLFKDRLLSTNREGLEEILPELTFTSNPLGHLELGVEVVVGASHLPDTDPVLSLEGELQGAPAKAGGQIHDEAHHVRQGNGVNIPERVQNTRHQSDYVLVLSLQSLSYFY